MKNKLTKREYEVLLTIAGFRKKTINLGLSEYLNRDLYDGDSGDYEKMPKSNATNSGTLYSGRLEKLSNIKQKLYQNKFINYAQSKFQTRSRGRSSELRYASLRTDRLGISKLILEMLLQDDIPRLLEFVELNHDLVLPILYDFDWIRSSLTTLRDEKVQPFSQYAKNPFHQKGNMIYDMYFVDSRSLIIKFLKYPYAFATSMVYLTAFREIFGSIVPILELGERLLDEKLLESIEYIFLQNIDAKSVLVRDELINVDFDSPWMKDIRKRLSQVVHQNGSFSSVVLEPENTQAFYAISQPQASIPPNLTKSYEDLALGYINKNNEVLNYDVRD